MKDYSLHYSYKNMGDVLIIIFDNVKKATHSENRGRVTVIYHDEEIIGYNIFDMKEIIKIKNDGMIYLPSPALVDVINTILVNAKCEPLDYKETSGYFTGAVVNIDNASSVVTISLGNEMVKAMNKKYPLNINDKVVIAKVGTRLPTGDIIKETNINNELINAHLCTFLELGIIEDEDKILILDEDIQIGKDFFSSEEK